MLDHGVPDTAQDEQQGGQANLYFVDVPNTFVKGDLDDRSITLRIKGQ